jgi:hypothetical protein
MRDNFWLYYFVDGVKKEGTRSGLSGDCSGLSGDCSDNARTEETDIEELVI